MLLNFKYKMKFENKCGYREISSHLLKCGDEYEEKNNIVNYFNIYSNVFKH